MVKLREQVGHLLELIQFSIGTAPKFYARAFLLVSNEDSFILDTSLPCRL